MLQKYPQAAVRVFAVWEPILDTDTARPGTVALAKLGDRRVLQFWDPDHRVAHQLERTEAAANLHPRCCVSDGFLWDLVAVFPPGERWDDAPPRPSVFNGTVVKTAPELEAALGR